MVQEAAVVLPRAVLIASLGTVDKEVEILNIAWLEYPLCWC